MEEKLTREEQKQQTKEQILETAIEMLLAPDFSSLNTNELAERANVSKGTIFHHFGTKGKLVLAAFEAIYIKQMEQFFIDHDQSEDPAEQLREFTKSNLELMSKHTNLNSLLLQYLSDMSSDNHKEFLNDFLEEFSEQTMGNLVQLFERLGWQNSNAQSMIISRLFLAMIDGLSIQIDIGRYAPDQNVIQFQLDPLVETIVALFDRRKPSNDNHN